MKKYIKDDKGAITLFVLVCVMFFLIALVSVQVYLSGKANSVQSEYDKIKQSYQAQNANEVYSQIVTQ